MSNQADFKQIFDSLHSILTPYVDSLSITVNEPDNIQINTNFIMPNKKNMFFGAAKIGKSYVSYHLMPVYVYPELLNDISADLKKHMQGKSCFNFKAVDNILFRELTELTKTCYIKFKKAGYT